MKNIPQTIALADISEFPLNPRRGQYRDLDRLKQSLQDNGQETALDIWRAADGNLQVLQGHRRLKCMQDLGWTECMCIIRDLPDDGHALAWLINQQESNDPFDHVERAVACADMLAAGLTMDETCRAVSRTPETVQLWLELGKMEAAIHKQVRAGNVSLETAGTLARLDKDERKEALQMVLNGMGGPMSTAQAKLMIEQRYIQPKKYETDWISLTPRLKKSLGAGYEVVAFANRSTYVQGDTGQPEDGYEWSTQALPSSIDDDVASWGAAAKKLGATQYVVPAPLHKDGYVVLTHKPTLKTLDSDQGGKIFGRERTVKESGGRMVEHTAPAAATTPEPTEEPQEDPIPVVEDSTPSALVRSRGITVAELKRHVAAWPESHDDGTPTRVWLEAFGFSITVIEPSNGCDMLIQGGAK